jgi:hypothetical protein
MIEDDGFETVVGLPKKKVYNVEVEGVVTRIFRIEAENSAKASELARSEFIINLGGNKDAVFVNDVWKE